MSNRSDPFLSPGVELEVLAYRRGRVIKSEPYDLKRGNSDRATKLTLVDENGETFELVAAEGGQGTQWATSRELKQGLPYSEPRGFTVMVIPNTYDDVTSLVIKERGEDAVRPRLRVPHLIEQLVKKVVG